MNKMLKRVLTGLLGILLTCALTAITFMYLINPEYEFVIYAALTVSVSLIAGFIGFIFGGTRKFVEIAPFGFFMTALIIGASTVPKEYQIVFTLSVLLAIIIYAIYIKTKSVGEKDIQKAKDYVLKACDEIKAEEPAGERKSILLLSRWRDCFQIIKGEDGYYFNNIGSSVRGIYPELVVKDFSDETGFLGKSRKDFVVAKDDIYMIRYYPKTEGTGTYSGNFTLFTDKGQKLFFIIEKVSESELREFFSGITDYAENPLGVNRDETDPEKVKKSKAGRIIRINNLLAIAAIVFSAAFYYKTWNYMVFSSACMLLSLSAFLLYIKYNDILAISESGKRKSGKVNIFFTMFLPAVVMLIRTVIDINIIEYTEFAIWSIAVFTVLALMFFFLSSEYKRAKSVILIILLFSVTFSVSAVAQANYIFDTEAPQTKLAVIEKKDFFGDKESPRTFYLYVSIDGIEYKIKVSSEVYNDNEQGENTPVNVYKGFFGIQYAKIL